MNMQPASQQVAFALDIDGVIVRGAHILEGAIKTLQWLQDHKIPFILLTNGGGLSEEAHAAKMSLRLGLTISPGQMIQSHTPYHAMVPEYQDKPVLVLGGHGQHIRQVAREYGFRNVITSSDIAKRLKAYHPFCEMTKSHHEEHGQLATGSNPHHVPNIAAVFIWSSPRDWCLDLQILLDLLLSRGGDITVRSPLHRRPGLPNGGFLQDGQPAVFSCNPDLEFASPHCQPRVAQGAFVAAVQGAWLALTGGLSGPFPVTLVGKPTQRTYAWADETLMSLGGEVWGDDGGSRGQRREKKAAEEKTGGPRRRTVFMVGDNPASDIAGANAFVSPLPGVRWRSILVETGVFRPGDDPLHRPDHVAADLRAAVEWAMAVATTNGAASGDAGADDSASPAMSQE